jgi:uncharacterized RDD family membrane protein YckC
MRATPGVAIESPMVEPVPFWPRAGARVIDTVYVFIVSLFATVIASVVLALLGSSVPAGWQHRMGQVGASGFALGYLASSLYYIASELVGGASVGKLLLGMRVLNTDYTPVSAKGAIVRQLATFIDFLCLAIPAYSAMQGSPMQQRYGDKWGDAVVVRARTVPPAGQKSTGLVMMGVVVGTVCAVVIQIAVVFMKAYGTDY